MKRIILVFITILFATTFFGQEKEKKYFKDPLPFDEFVISVNRTYGEDKNRFGCGAGVYHSSVLSERWNYMYGLEYNYISFFTDYLSHRKYPGGYRYEKNVTFHIHTISVIPVAFRFSMGKNVKYFLEAGLLLGLSFADKKGDAYSGGSHSPDQSVPIGGGGISPHTGPSFGAGMRIPMKSIEWVVKADYQMGGCFITGYEFYQYYRLGVGIRKRK